MGSQTNEQPPAEQVSSSLQFSLHAATRSLHAQLNKSIMSRFPQCLPPNAQEPLAYHLGMLVFGNIFEEFEKAIETVQRKPATSEVSERRRRMVEQQRTSSLPRTAQLQHDRNLLRKRLCSCRHTVEGLNDIEQRLQAQMQEQTRHIAQRIQERPHLALAYTWTMYLALFNGGRHLYRALARPGPDFWLEDDDANSPPIRVLSFWRFDAATEADPEADQLKLTFKQNFDDASSLLTEIETDEVVQEAKSLFELCMRLIGLLDVVMAEVQSGREQSSTVQGKMSQDNGLAARLWAGLSNSVLRPAYHLVGWQWTRPIHNNVRAVQ